MLGVFVLIATLAKASAVHYAVLKSPPIYLSVIHLPYYALRSVFRMLVAMVISVIFTFIFGTWAAKSRFAERVIIPLIDVFQSVPVLGFFACFCGRFYLVVSK